VTITGLLSLIFFLLFFGLIIILAVAGRNRPGIELRQIEAFTKVRKAIENAVEAGSQLHISIGRGTATGPESASAFVGLSVLEQMTTSASSGDSPPTVSTGDSTLSILAQDTLKNAYQDIGSIDQYKPTSSQLTGLTPFSYAAGAIPIVSNKKTKTSILIGNYGIESALLTDACEQAGNITLAGTDDITGQAVLYATADEQLIGEELYAGGAYIKSDPIHTASLRAQDVIRLLLVTVILLGILARLIGFEQNIIDFLGSLL
jgi:hypothetical protein